MSTQQSASFFKPKLKVISNEQIKKIHSATLEVLERTGVKMTHPRGLELLDGAGARVDGDRVRIPAWLVEEAIRKAPSRIVLGKRNGDRTNPLSKQISRGPIHDNLLCSSCLDSDVSLLLLIVPAADVLQLDLIDRHQQTPPVVHLHRQ